MGKSIANIPPGISVLLRRGIAVLAIALGTAAAGDDSASLHATERLPLGAEAVERTPLGIGPAAAGQGQRETERLPLEGEAMAGGMPDGFLRTGAALLGVIVLILVCGAVVRRAMASSPGLAASFGGGGRGPSGLLEVLGRYPIGGGQTLILLKVDRRIVLLSHTGGFRARSAATTTLCEITEPEDVASILVKARDEEGESLSQRFSALLSKFGHGEQEAVYEQAEGAGVLRAVFRNGAGDHAELAGAGAAPAGGSDPVGSLRRRLDSLRRRGGGQ